MDSPSGAKRRRYDSSGGGYADSPSYAVGPGQYSYSQPYPHGLPHHVRPPPPPQQHPVHRHPSLGGPGISSPAYAPQPGGPLPGPPQVGGRGSIGMAPPPRPASVAYPQPAPPRRDTVTPSGGGGGFDESLRLPPLQTPAPPPAAHHHPGQQPASPTSTTGTAGPTSQTQQQRDLDSQARGVEAMIMSIPYINKLKVLEKIAPPLASSSAGPGPGGVETTRGPVIAIEGAVPSLVRQVGAIVERALAASGECAVRVWSSSEDGKREGEGGGQQLGFATYLQTITEWHGRSGEIVKHITTSPEVVRRTSDVSMGSSSGDEKKSNAGSVAGGGEATRSSSVNTAASVAQQQQKSSQSRQQQRALVPVALLTDGFSLTISDRFACRVPIADSYAPVDHWQWMATLWRGIVGPDLVVYVRGAEEEEMTRLQAVEMIGAEVMKVRVVVPPGAGGGAMDQVLVGEKVERRLGFEVVEWVRNGSFKEGF
ncbi:hypothetical protein CONLIGDRAFT_634293 [Coniochaeta ligniaria NRRL 30616]|uniref:Uncharacterized protein n=1 Tax=Coniochaeta ligniaria NRRL 30616 TaxID=1408157 RepID=A0A1J7IKH4_9PEZI|nr:hypothetical protein CONLIGDRAFT_634293 [Coniochaeta ligniaria NRRL 30616]